MHAGTKEENIPQQYEQTKKISKHNDQLYIIFQACRKFGA